MTHPAVCGGDHHTMQGVVVMMTHNAGCGGDDDTMQGVVVITTTCLYGV